MSETLRVRVLVIGAGPSGLRAAADLAERLDGTVLVVERESTAGGIPRHSHHTGFGIRDLKRSLSGPRYARLLRQRAERAGARILTETMVTGWVGPHSVVATSRRGRLRIEADAVVLATGARERPRSARLIAGDRVQGVYTTGSLQNAVDRSDAPIGRHAVVLGTELVSWSAVMTLRSAGCRSAVLVTPEPRPETYGLLTKAARLAFGVEVATSTRLTSIVGRGRVEAVELRNLTTGNTRTVACDTVVLTGSWVADNELARALGAPLEPSTGAPLIDMRGRTAQEGVFAVGNLTHPVATADVAALSGAAVVEHVLAYLDGTATQSKAIEVRAGAGVRWVSPASVDEDSVRRGGGRLVLWADEYRSMPRVVVRQDGTVIATRRRLLPVFPGRVFRLRAALLRAARPEAGDVSICVE